MENEFLQMEMDIVNAIKNVYDPEIPVNVYDLGLIYKIDIMDEGKVQVTMTLTSPNCPVAESLPEEVHDVVAGVKGVTKVEVIMTFDPPWSREMLTDEALLELGLM